MCFDHVMFIAFTKTPLPTNKCWVNCTQLVDKQRTKFYILLFPNQQQSERYGLMIYNWFDFVPLAYPLSISTLSELGC